MFNVKYPDGSLLKKMLQGSLKPLSEAPIKADENSFLIRGLSPDKNIMVEIYIPSMAFETYDVSGETKVVADRDEFLKAVRRGTKRDTVVLRYEDGSETMILGLINTKTGSERTYQVRVIGFGQELIQSLELDLPVKMQMEPEEFRKIISDAKLVGEELEISYKEGEVTVSSRSEGKEFREVLKLDKPLLSLESKESAVTSMYDIDLLKSVAPSLDIGDVVTVEFGAGLPMKLLVTSDDGSKITVWVAPRAA